MAKTLIPSSLVLTAVGLLTSVLSSSPVVGGRDASPPAKAVVEASPKDLYRGLLPTSANFVPIAVWDQGWHAALFRSMGINIMLGMNAWPEKFGSDDGELAQAVAAHMYVIGGGDPSSDTSAGSVASIAALIAKTPGAAKYFIGYQWIDEPSCTTDIASEVATISSEDSTRLTYANEGAWAAFLPVNTVGSATCLSESEANLVAPSIASSDDYAITDPWHSAECIGPKCIYLYGDNAVNMRKLAGPDKPVWEFIESGTNYGLSQQNPADPCDWKTNLCKLGNEVQATPVQVNSAAWEALLGGVNGIEWFCDELTESGKAFFDYCASNATIRSNLTYIDHTIEEFAPEINSPTVSGAVTTQSSDKAVPIIAEVRKVGGSTYLFVESNRPGATTATYTLGGFPDGSATLLYDSNARYDPSVSDQGKSFLLSSNGSFSDSLPTSYTVKIYEIDPAPPTWWAPR